MASTAFMTNKSSSRESIQVLTIFMRRPQYQKNLNTTHIKINVSQGGQVKTKQVIEYVI